MTTAIPVDQIVSMVPGVVGAGGVEGLLTGVVFSQDPSLPFDTLWTAYANTDAGDWFGGGTNEALAADTYFPGIVNGGQLPYDLVYTRYAASAGAAEIYGAQLESLTLQQLQALSGDLTIYSGGNTFTAADISLSAATSFPSAATIMQAAFTSPPFTIAYDGVRERFTVTNTATGTASVMADASGVLAGDLGLTVATGSSLVATGFVADTPATALARLVALTDNFATFTHAWAATLTDRLAFAAANSVLGDKYLYVGWDTDAADATPNNAASFGYQTIYTFKYEGTLPVYGTIAHAAGAMAWAAASNYDLTDGRTDLAFRQLNAGTAASATTLALANALLTNGYTYYGFYKKGSNTWNVFYNGQVSGKFLWSDTYLDQIWLNSNLQLSTFSAFLAYNSIPYNEDGYTDIYAAAKTIIDAAVINGIIRPNVTLTESQRQQINSAAGLDAASSISTRGWYLLITDPANVGSARTSRSSPVCILWYADGGSIQKLTFGSNAVI